MGKEKKCTLSPNETMEAMEQESTGLRNELKHRLL